MGQQARRPRRSGQDSGGLGVKSVTLEVSYDGAVIEKLDNLVMDPTSPDDLFVKVNALSRVLVAIDPLFGKGLPAAITKGAVAKSDARAALAVLKTGATDVVTVQAK